jgi:RHS repeat-associated protein
MAMAGRSYSAGEYRYGSNGKEKDPEGMGGGVSTYDYGFRIYNPQIAKFLSLDPLMKDYPELTPYQFASNNPIESVDLDGLESFSSKNNPNQVCQS